MSYKEKPQLKLYTFTNNQFILQAIIDDYQECSFEDNLYDAGQFSVTINFNIPNSQLFQRGLFIQFGSSWKFGEITKIQDQIGEDGKGSQFRIITGYDARYILERRVIKNMNSNGLWVMSGKGEIVLRNLINDQCGTNAENKRKLPIVNTIPTSENAIGKEYSASEQFSNLYEICKTIATQSEIGWRLEFDGTSLTLVCFEGTDRTQTVQFSTSFDSLENGEFTDSSESFANAIYVGGKGQNDDRDIYEGESAIEGNSPSGLDRYESWDNQSSMTTESEYETEALSMLNQYGQTLTMSGKGLAKCPYEYEKEYFVGDKIKIAFSGKSANAQILSVTEHWAFGTYEINFSFGKPLPDLNAQLQLILKQIQKASNKTNSTDSVRWYTIPTDSVMPSADVTYNTIGFVGDVGSGATFRLYLDNEKTGAKTYHVWFKQLAGNGKLTLTTGKSGAVDLSFGGGTYVAIISVDEAGNIVNVASTPTNTIAAGNNQPTTSEGVAQAISDAKTALQPVDIVASGNLHSVTSNAVFYSLFNATMLSFWQDDTKKDPLAVADSLATNWFTPSATDRFATFRLGHNNSENTPYGNGNTDFYYHMFKLTDSLWIKLLAYDARDSGLFQNTKVNGVWQGWQEIQRIVSFTDDSPILTPNELLAWARVDFRNGIVCLYARFVNYQTQHTFTDGEVIGRLKPEHYPTYDFPGNVHDFANKQDYLIWIGVDGSIKIFGLVGTQTMFYDFYISATYEI